MKNSCLASLIAFLLMIFLSVFILAGQIRILASPTFVSKIIKESQILTQLSNFINVSTQSQAETGKINLNTTALTKVVIQSIEPNQLETEFDRLARVFFDYSRGKTQNLEVTIDLSEWKTSFKQKWPVLAPPIFRAEYEKLAACKAGEQPQKMVNGAAMIDCQSSDLSAATLEELVRQTNPNDFIKTIPDQWSLTDFFQKNQPLFDKIRLVFNILNLAFWLSLVLSVLAIISLVALGWPNGRAICGWHGWVFVIVAGPIFVLDLLSPKLFNISQSLWSGQIDQSTASALAGLAGNINRAIIQTTISLPAVVLGLGVILVILSFVLPKYEPRVVPPGFEKK